MSSTFAQRKNACKEIGAQFGCNGLTVEYASGHAVAFVPLKEFPLDSNRPRSWTPWILTAVVAAAAIVILVPLFRATSTRAAGPAGLAGTQAPVITLQDDAGSRVSIETYRGKVVLMNLWATWCPPCREELPDLQRLFAAQAARGLVVLGVDQGESPARARAFAQSLGLHFPIWIDAQQAYGRAYDALGFPTTVVIDRGGTIVAGFDGPLTYEQMRAAVAAPLGQR